MELQNKIPKHNSFHYLKENKMHLQALSPIHIHCSL
uniref:Uncharacterized protein n=1 Tax=Anguilla anguilla TaxID=7936 RepID=A0A0E9R9A3_ANGAN